MISHTGSGTSPNIPTVSSRPGMNCSAMTSSSYRRASSAAASSPLAVLTSVMPTDDPILDGFTITGQPSGGHVLGRDRRHEPGGNRHPGGAEEPLREVLVHGERAAQRAAPRVRHADDVQDRLQRAAFAAARVQAEQEDVRLPDGRELCQLGGEEMTLLLVELGGRGGLWAHLR